MSADTPSNDSADEPSTIATPGDGGEHDAQMESSGGKISMSVRSFIRRQILAKADITDEEIHANWVSLKASKQLSMRVIKRERTLFAKLQSYDQRKGLIDFFNSQAQLLLTQYQNIEQLLGPSDSDWSWPGEHCEVLLRQAIADHLPPNFAIGKGYILGVRNTEKGPLRSPEVDILVYDSHLFPPIFQMGQFVIVRPESVVAALQVKRTLDANTLVKALDNVVDTKRHVLETCSFNPGVTTEKMFAGIVCFQDSLSDPDVLSLSSSYRTALQTHMTSFHDGYFLPDYIGTLDGIFLHFLGMNINQMGYQAFPSVADGKNVALPFLLFMLTRKIRPFGLHLPPALPEEIRIIEYLELWRKAEEPTQQDPDSP